MGSYLPTTIIPAPLLPSFTMDHVSIQDHLSSFSTGKMLQHLNPIYQTLQVTSLTLAPKSLLCPAIS